MAMGRLNTFADDDVPQEMIQNISNVIELPVIKKSATTNRNQVIVFNILFNPSPRQTRAFHIFPL